MVFVSPSYILVRSRTLGKDPTVPMAGAFGRGRLLAKPESRDLAEATVGARIKSPAGGRGDAERARDPKTGGTNDEFPGSTAPAVVRNGWAIVRLE